jgi:hypothetical protein
MRIVIVYIYPLDGVGEFGVKASRFIDSYRRFPPGMAHDTVIICNGGKASLETEGKFSFLPNVQLLEHDGKGKDIGGFLKAAGTVDADLMVFFGGNTYFRRSDWMVPIVRSWFRKGDTLFGATAHPGEGSHIHPHIRTTGFWMRPKLFIEYCPTIIGDERRYELEHGVSCLTNWFKNKGMTPWVVSWTGEHELHNCQHIPNGYRNGDQSNVIFGDRLTE